MNFENQPRHTLEGTKGGDEAGTKRRGDSGIIPNDERNEVDTGAGVSSRRGLTSTFRELADIVRKLSEELRGVETKGRKLCARLSSASIGPPQLYMRRC